MAATNPLSHYFRQPALYTKLPTSGKWYNKNDIDFVSDSEIAVFGLTALDEILLNTPDAMLNGQALEKVIKNCVPSIKNIKHLTVPDLETIFLSIKIATNNGKYELSRTCPKCQHENDFDINCQHLLDTMTFVEEPDTVVSFNDELIVHIRPYNLEMRQLFLAKEFDEQRTLRAIDSDNKDLDDFEKTRILGESIERISKITFSLVAKSIEKITMVKEKISVTDPEHISEWLINISKNQADAVIQAVNRLNDVGVQKKVTVTCTNCNHEWEETLSFDPISFFGKR